VTVHNNKFQLSFDERTRKTYSISKEQSERQEANAVLATFAASLQAKNDFSS